MEINRDEFIALVKACMFLRKVTGLYEQGNQIASYVVKAGLDNPTHIFTAFWVEGVDVQREILARLFTAWCDRDKSKKEAIEKIFKASREYIYEDMKKEYEAYIEMMEKRYEPS